MNFKAENNEWHHGFQMTFGNQFTISVQFSKHNYSDQGKTTAEVAAWNNNGDWFYFDDNKWNIIENKDTDVMSHQTTDDVARMISELVKLK
jgi:uncharacterized protein YneR